MELNSLNSILSTSAVRGAGKNDTINTRTNGIPFKDLLSEAVNTLNDTDRKSVAGSYDLLINDNADLHNIMIAAEKADIALQFTLQIRNKIIESYNEIMRMQV